MILDKISNNNYC